MTPPNHREELLIARGLSKWFKSQNHSTVADMVRGWRKGSRKILAIENVDLTVRRGECVAILGANGSGKSTLLRCLAGIVVPNRGDTLVLGKMAALLSHGFGAYEELPVWRNILLVQQLLGASLVEAKSRIAAIAEHATLTDRLYGPCSQLSEGMRAKISLSSLAFTSFDVALLDESLNHVDSEYRDKYFQLTRDWIKEGRSLIITSHDDHLLTSFSTIRMRMHNNSLIQESTSG